MWHKTCKRYDKHNSMILTKFWWNIPDSNQFKGVNAVSVITGTWYDNTQQSSHDSNMKGFSCDIFKGPIVIMVVLNTFWLR